MEYAAKGGGAKPVPKYNGLFPAAQKVNLVSALSPKPRGQFYALIRMS